MQPMGETAADEAVDYPISVEQSSDSTWYLSAIDVDQALQASDVDEQGEHQPGGVADGCYNDACQANYRSFASRSDSTMDAHAS